MLEKTFTVIEEAGIHARPASVLVSEADKFDADVYLTFKGKRVSLKSIMGVMALGIPKGSKITIAASGPDEDEALATLTQTMESLGVGE
jgi:phosphocarrier protein